MALANLKARSHDKQKVSIPRPLRPIACPAYSFSPIKFLKTHKKLCIKAVCTFWLTGLSDEKQKISVYTIFSEF